MGKINPFHRLKRSSSAHNDNLQPFNVAGVVAAPIVYANADELDDYKIDDDDGIIAVGDIPQQPPQAPLVVNDTDNDDGTMGSGNDDDGKDLDGDEDDDNSSNEDDEDDELPAVTNALEGSESDSKQGVRRSQHRGKGTS